ncbi:MAG: hypothetical protein Q4D38_12155 [Planctomycetia bacterium]|nr:hypothetical protein [Planctomycetia bacterium]
MREKEKVRKVLCLSIRAPMYERLKALCLEETLRRREPVTVCQIIREMIARTVDETDK